MKTGRLEAFSDGVIAVIITITVLDLKVPTDTSTAALLKQVPMLLTYFLSFMVVGILWINHHHLLHLARRPTGRVMWANNMLLFFMSLVPFTTSYMGNNHAAPLAVALYGAVMAFVGLSFTVLRLVVCDKSDGDHELDAANASAVRKSLISAALYAASVPLAYVSPRISIGIFVLIPMAYFLPERKITEWSETISKSKD